MRRVAVNDRRAVIDELVSEIPVATGDLITPVAAPVQRSDDQVPGLPQPLPVGAYLSGDRPGQIRNRLTPALRDPAAHVAGTPLSVTA